MNGRIRMVSSQKTTEAAARQRCMATEKREGEMEQVSMGMGVEATVSRQKMTNLAVFASLIGTTIEWYDFFLYGTITGLVFGKLFGDYPLDAGKRGRPQRSWR